MVTVVVIMMQAQLTAAWDAFSKAVQEQEDHAPALHSLGTLAVIRGDFDAAIEYHKLGKVS